MTNLCLYPPRQLGFAFHFAIVFKIIIASQVCDDVTNDNSNQPFVIVVTNNNSNTSFALDDNSNQFFALGETMCHHNANWATIFLATLWVLLHVMMLLSTVCPSFVTNYVRLAAPARWVRCPFLLSSL